MECLHDITYLYNIIELILWQYIQHASEGIQCESKLTDQATLNRNFHEPELRDQLSLTVIFISLSR